MKAYQSLGLMAILAMALSYGVMACDTTGPGKSIQIAAAKPVSANGTVVYRETGGGFYGILSDNGGQYEPANLDARFRTDGLRISFSGSLDTAALGDHHWGNPIELAAVSETR